LPPAMGQFSSTRSGPPPEALLHRAEPDRSVVPELHGGRKRGPRRRASGDLAYTVAFEHATASVNRAPPQPYILRVTTVFRREHGDWKIVHPPRRPADPLASGPRPSSWNSCPPGWSGATKRALVSSAGRAWPARTSPRSAHLWSAG
jgi:hypothetical protein